MVLQICLILFQCLIILPSCIPFYTMICITFLMFFIPLTLTPGSLFYSLAYFVLLLNSFPSNFSTRDTLILFTSSDDVLELYTGTRKSYLNVEAIEIPWESMESPWCSMVHRVTPMVCHGKSMVSNGKPLVFHGKPKEHHGVFL